MEEEYQFDAFDDGSSLLVGKAQQEKMGEFTMEFATKLREMEEALDASLVEVWDPLCDPVELMTSAYERANLLDLVKTDNKVFMKIVLVFSSLVLEMKKLRSVSQKRFYSPFLIFGLEVKDGELSEGETQIKIGRLLPFFKEFSDFVGRATDVVRNVVRQLSSLYIGSSEIFKASFKHAHLEVVFSELGRFLGEISFLDEICRQNKMLQQAWAMYKRMTKAVKTDPTRYNLTEAQALKYEKILLQMEGNLFEGQMFCTIVQQEFDFENLVIVKKNKDFRAEFSLNLKKFLSRLDPKTEKKLPSDPSRDYVMVCALYGLYFNVFQDVSEKKLFKAVWDISNIYPIVHISGNVTWSSTEFLAKRVQYMTKTMIGNKFNAMAHGQAFVRKLDQEFEAKVSSYHNELSVWMTRMESSLGNRADLRQMLDTRSQLFMDGIRIATEVSSLYKVFALMHVAFRVAVKPVLVIRLCNCVEILKSIQYTFLRKSAMIGESLGYMIQQIQYYLQSRFHPLKVKLEENKAQSMSIASLDALSSLTILLQMINGPPTPERRVVLEICMYRVFAAGHLKSQDISQAMYHTEKLSLLSDIRSTIDRVCDCSFMIWNTAMLPLYFKDIFENPLKAPCMQYMFSAINDIQKHFSRAIYLESEALEEYAKEIITVPLEEHVLKPLRLKIEMDLRLQIHSHLKVADRDPFRNGSKDVSIFLNMGPLRLFQDFIDIKHHITQYLDSTFYNLTTVALFDWKTYAEMRNLARDKYGLHLTEVHLPGQTLEQGLDVLEIMRNIHVFVSRFYYNLNNQVFIEKMSESKSLNTINIQHVANSIRTHGAGIMNTTVNFTYQFLRRKFVIFSQFLYDDHIKSRLLKDSRFFREKKMEINNQYPYDRADRFNKEIRRLGVTAEGFTYLDQFRMLITEIGNAMGYVRLIRSGGLRFISNSIKFVPDLRNISNFKEMSEEEQLSKETISAATNLDEVLANLHKHFSEGSDYFKMLTKVFTKEFRNPNNVHLSNFYTVIPPLTINYVEHILGLKDQLAKEAKRGGKSPGSFTDDGFAIGLVYILKLLDQFDEFDSLHWFRGTLEKFAKEKADCTAQLERAQRKKAKQRSDQDEGLIQSLSMSLRRNQRYVRELEMLWFCFSGARIFFRFNVEDKPPEEKREEEEGSSAPPPDSNGTGAPAAPPPPPN
mmetsp:Transcript_35230/g.48134  ORF Transcript_35230/g.48134 Transcript_35230/m.48134 type:complete len:1177 (-) Transcript_35230:275-3805(-)|eukprot:CAMPEP_0201477148 /NCGR_PEP_ID=MMETSP0151_2-20130828/2232_1 /ASSEMBLY_ACC=CAM_ASM_000257 /TAXON_ID=200890 /ORGANISM="Paramoeba atlantica, Strain 621/1 / CCAP 1560/9" /LENGTH=1176 /DNA_ID=CAMNT_0047857773 /DNA_START=131 /DNA_END=3661 /DNA_ORIENTATION=+